ncbi:MAG: RelA/SpoT family protein [bacterium]|nr:RelA/SpoT family protein [bacterium]
MNLDPKINNLYNLIISKVDNNKEIVEKAFKIAYNSHLGQYRASSEPYIIHPLEVALILTDYFNDHITISSAILHDIVEDTNTTLEDIYELFGNEIGFIVESLTKLQKLFPKIKQIIYEENTDIQKKELNLANLRRLFISTAKDIRVIAIKLADRLHNLRTLNYLDKDKQKRIAQESLDFYVPIAQKLGIWKIKSEMEDLAFYYLNPEEYKKIENYIQNTKKLIIENHEKVINIIQEKLKKENINAVIKSRIKTVYSIYNKMIKRKVPLNEIMDIGAIRIIVEDVKECYLVLGILHSLWMPIQDRIKDYIAKPKPNGYQSLHTVVYNGYPIEIQIRTKEMDYIAEYGVASHWKYKGFKDFAEYEKIIENWKKNIEGIEELKEEGIKEEILNTTVFVFTPKGDCIDLPEGSTPIDLAYRIHTEVGNKCIGAKVNGRIVNLSYKLKSGDIVEIITSKNATPNIEWLKITKTNYAKSRIKQFLKKKNKQEYIKTANDIFSETIKTLYKSLNLEEIKDLPKEIKEFLETDKVISLIYENYYKNAFQDIEDFLIAIGFGDIKRVSIENRIKEFFISLLEKNNINSNKLNENNTKINLATVNLNTLKEGVLYKFAKCCSPVLPDEIIGFITRGNGISIHKKNCKNIMYYIKNNKLDNIISLNWDDIKSNIKVEINILAKDRKGLLQDVLKSISDKTVNLLTCQAQVNNNSLANIQLILEVPKNFNIKNIESTIKSKFNNEIVSLDYKSI